jgi:CO dehydrogenase/acetyl-CoA synthase gamma subunit (corrinoid Fe-S protein)
MVKEYKTKCDILSQAIRNLKSVEILTYENKILKLEQIVIDSGKFFGMENIKGEFKKLLLNVNKIKKIIIL